MKTDAIQRVLFFSLLFVSQALLAEPTRQFTRVGVQGQGHPPLYLEPRSIHWTGDVASFIYVVDVPTPGAAAEQPGAWRSNEVEASIDCKANTGSTGRVQGYLGPKATGGQARDIVAAQPPARVMEKLDPQSTLGILRNFVCVIRR